MLSLEQFKILFPSFSIILKLLIVLILGFFVWHSWQLYKMHEFYLLNFFKLSFKDKTPHLIFDILKYEWYLFYTIIIQIGILFIIKAVINRIPISKKTILQWEEAGEINPILGRFIASHFRYHKFINLYQIYSLIQFANSEKYFLKFHNNGEFKNKFLVKYDFYHKNDTQQL